MIEALALWIVVSCAADMNECSRVAQELSNRACKVDRIQEAWNDEFEIWFKCDPKAAWKLLGQES